MSRLSEERAARTGYTMRPSSRIYVAGHRGLVGSAVERRLRAAGYGNLIQRTREELDLTRQAEVEAFFRAERPEVVVLAAAKVGGIGANRARKAEFIRINLQIETNVIAAAHLAGVAKLLFLGSSCIYPRECPQPMKEEHLLTGPLEPTNDAYAVAKIAGIQLCRAYNEQHGTNFIAAMPTNLYGPGDNFDLESAHVLPAMIAKFHLAKMDAARRPVVLWGSGAPRREFLHVDDLASACLFLLERVDAGAAPGDLYNVGVGEDLSIRELADKVQRAVGYQGEVVWDASKPDGTPRKLLDVSRLRDLGWKASRGLDEGIGETYGWYQENVAKGG